MKKVSFQRMPHSSFYLFPLLLIFIFTSCEKDSLIYPAPDSVDLRFNVNNEKPEKNNTFYGPAQKIGNGVVQAFVVMSHSGDPQAVGVRFKEKTLEGLPHHPEEITLKLPNKTNGLYIDHIDFGWNPEGHEPPGVYDTPHFDIHLYFISEFEKMQMTDDAMGDVLPPLNYWPYNYVPTPGYVPMMGKHWLNLDSNEAMELPFDQTFIYGSYNGELIFYEPMITLDYLQMKTNEEFAIHQPENFPRSGYYYPTKYSINYDETKKEYTVMLFDMVWRIN